MNYKRKVLIFLFSSLLIFSIFNFAPNSASAATQDVILHSDQSSASTKRITTNSKLSFVINNVGSKPVYYNIFRYGVLHSSGLTVQPGKVVMPGAGTVTAGEYSLRIYCGSRSNPSSSGCQAKGTISGN